MRLLADYHTHTYYSHGKGSIKDNILAAREKGLREIAITDHGPASHSLIRLGVNRAEVFLQIKDEVESLRDEFPEIKVLVGTEANIINLEGELDIPVNILSQLDIILVGLHILIKPASFYDGLHLIANNVLGRRLSNRLAQEARLRNTTALERTLHNYRVDIITHPGYGLDIDSYRLARACKEKGVALEISGRHSGMTPEYLQIGQAEGVEFVVGSDAHRPEEVGSVERALDVITRAGLPLASVINVV
ncbi:MAG: PHP domain-containing protein [Halanaerobium sp.]|nr:PHP domain-containing protein [Halanaerobium sp.]